MKRSPAQIAVRLGFFVAIVAALLLGAQFMYNYFRPTVDVTAAVNGPVVQAFYATGTVEPQREYSVRSPVAGIVQISHAQIDKGSHVQKGQLLGIVDNGDLKFALQQADAELKRRQALADEQSSPVLAELKSKLAAEEAMLKLAQDDEDRVAALVGRGTSQSSLDDATDKVKATWSDVESFKDQIASKRLDLQRDLQTAQAARDDAQWQLDQATIRSPIDGTVLDWPISDGTRVAINDPILTLADVSPNNLVMRAQVDEEDKNRLFPPSPNHPPQEVKMTLYAYGGKILAGHVKQIYDKADPDRRTYEVDVAFDNPDPDLAAGMTGELNFIVTTIDDALVVPSQAVQAGSVMIVRDGRLARPDVEIGIRSIERTQIISGLNPGDVVVLSPLLDLASNQRVRTHFIDPVFAAQLNRPVTSSESPFGIH